MLMLRRSKNIFLW